MFTVAGLDSGMGIGRGRKRQGGNSPFNGFIPFGTGVLGGSRGVGATRSLI